jgi:mRNA interferase MazF
MYVRRGELWLARMIGVGSMQTGIRPVIIVSNKKCNMNSGTITVLEIEDINDRYTVVPLTTKKKTPLPTHVDMESSMANKKSSIALCECITTIDKSLLIRKLGDCSTLDMLKINMGMLIQLGIDVFEMIKYIVGKKESGDVNESK